MDNQNLIRTKMSFPRQQPLVPRPLRPPRATAEEAALSRILLAAVAAQDGGRARGAELALAELAERAAGASAPGARGLDVLGRALGVCARAVFAHGWFLHTPGRGEHPASARTRAACPVCSAADRAVVLTIRGCEPRKAGHELATLSAGCRVRAARFAAVLVELEPSDGGATEAASLFLGAAREAMRAGRTFGERMVALAAMQLGATATAALSPAAAAEALPPLVPALARGGGAMPWVVAALLHPSAQRWLPRLAPGEADEVAAALRRGLLDGAGRGAPCVRASATGAAAAACALALCEHAPLAFKAPARAVALVSAATEYAAAQSRDAEDEPHTAAALAYGAEAVMRLACAVRDRSTFQVPYLNLFRRVNRMVPGATPPVRAGLLSLVAALTSTLPPQLLVITGGNAALREAVRVGLNWEGEAPGALRVAAADLVNATLVCLDRLDPLTVLAAGLVTPAPVWARTRTPSVADLASDGFAADAALAGARLAHLAALSSLCADDPSSVPACCAAVESVLREVRCAGPQSAHRATLSEAAFWSARFAALASAPAVRGHLPDGFAERVSAPLAALLSSSAYRTAAAEADHPFRDWVDKFSALL